MRLNKENSTDKLCRHALKITLYETDVFNALVIAAKLKTHQDSTLRMWDKVIYSTH